MPESPTGYKRFFAELKRRKVFRVTAVYGLVGFIALQVVDLLVPALLLPECSSGADPDSPAFREVAATATVV